MLPLPPDIILYLSFASYNIKRLLSSVIATILVFITPQQFAVFHVRSMPLRRLF